MQKFGMRMLLKQQIATKKVRGIKTMVNCRELRLKCDVCNECIMWNIKKVCSVCEKDNRSEIVINCNDEEKGGN